MNSQNNPKPASTGTKSPAPKGHEIKPDASQAPKNPVPATTPARKGERPLTGV